MPLPVNSPATTVWDFLAEATSGTAARSPVPNRRSPAYIRWVQSSLNRVMKAGLTADGRVGPRTRQALRAFQQQKGLVAGGVVGPATERALVAAGAPAFSGRRHGPSQSRAGTAFTSAHDSGYRTGGS